MKPFRLKPEELREDDIEKACLDLLAVRGYKVLRLHAGRYWTLDKKRIVTIGEPGLADYHATHGRGQHRSFFMEVKRPGGKPKANQDKWAQHMRIAHPGIPVICVDSARKLADWLIGHERSP